jgi:Flp pilus assembly protein TadG
MRIQIHNKVADFLAARRGNVTIIVALIAIPLFIAVGVALDYAVAAQVKTELAAVADAAALSATTPAMMTQSASNAQTAATNMFAAQAALIKGFAYNANNLAVTVTDTTSVTKTRNVSVVYAAQVANVFGGLYLRKYTNFTVVSKASLSTAPNIDFYLLLDNSPSMELPATTAGITTMSGYGCAFACHEQTTNDSDYSSPYPGWGAKTGPTDTNTYTDSYTFAENNGITLRIDNVRAAAQSLATTAQSVMAANGAAYRLGAYAYNYNLTKMQSLVPITAGTVKSISSNIGAMTPPLMAANNNLAGNQSYTYPTSAGTASSPASYTTVQLGSSALYNNDTMTDFDQAMTQMSGIIKTPGNGTNAAGDKPQAVLMIVTDGMVDASNYSSSSCNSVNGVTYPLNAQYSDGQHTLYRCIEPIDTTYCDAIKKNNIRIAVLYTTYQPVTESWSVNNAMPVLQSLASNLQACASSPELYFEVNTDGDITAAMNTLFLNAVSTAPHLTQ